MLPTARSQQWAAHRVEHLPPTISAFEKKCQSLGLVTEEQMIASPELKNWVRRNKHSRFVPEDLLLAWHLTVDYVVGSGYLERDTCRI